MSEVIKVWTNGNAVRKYIGRTKKMKRFEIIISEIVDHQHRVVVEAESEYEVLKALDEADGCRAEFVSDYISRIRQEVNIVRHTEDYFVDVKEIEYFDLNELGED